jgi:hypothetical protein
VLGACATPTPWPDPTAISHATRAGDPLAFAGVEVELPAPGGVLPLAEPALVTGRAHALAGADDPYDIVFAIDISRSAEQPASSNPDAWYPPLDEPRKPVPTGSVLAVEVEAVRRMLQRVDTDRHRMAIVTFSGELTPPNGWYRGIPSLKGDPASTVVGLTRDHARLERALDAILADGTIGYTHMAAGLRQATADLVGGPGARSQPDPAARKVIVLLTDGTPTLPYLHYERGNEREVAAESDRAASYGIRIFSYAIGPEALARPLACVTAADRTGGRFSAVRDASVLPEIVSEINLARIEAVRVRNQTSGQEALAVALHPDGRWEALVSLVAGGNVLQITAVPDTGAEAVAERVVEAHASAPPAEIPPLLIERYGVLAERAANEALQRRRLELLAELRREVEQARARAAAQRKDLELELAP